MQIGNITRVIIHFEPLQILMTANGKWLLQVLRLSGFPPGGWQGIGWFRLHLSVDSSLLHLPLALEVNQMEASEIYLDRVKLYMVLGRWELQRGGGSASIPQSQSYFIPRQNRPRHRRLLLELLGRVFL